MFKSNKAKAIISLCLFIAWVLVAIFNTNPSRFEYIILAVLIAIEQLIDAVYYYTGTRKTR